RWPRLDRFREHTIELPVAELVVRVDAEATLRDSLHRALEFGKGVVHVQSVDGSAGNARRRKKGKTPANGVEVFSTKRAGPVCNRSFPEAGPRLFSFNSKHGWCQSCFGTGLKLRGFDEEQTGDEVWWNAWYEGEEHVCPSCNGQRLNRDALAVRFAERSI